MTGDSKFDDVAYYHDASGNIVESGGAHAACTAEFAGVLMQSSFARGGVGSGGGGGGGTAAAADDDTSFDPVVVMDDNMDGSYAGSSRLCIAGIYRLKVSVDGLEVQGSPFEVRVRAAEMCAKRSVVWWGRYADPATALQVGGPGGGGSAGGYGTAVRCCVGNALLFTVSARDSWGNKCVENEGRLISVQVFLVDADHTPTGAALSTTEFTKSTNGVFPCYFQSPDAPGQYAIHILLDGSNPEKRHMQGSPFLLTVNVAQAPEESAAEEKAAELNTQREKDIKQEKEDEDVGGGLKSSREIAPEDDEGAEKNEELYTTLRRQELTRKRAEDALRKERLKVALEREEKRRQKAVKRTGGGFIIQYSKEI